MEEDREKDRVLHTRQGQRVTETKRETRTERGNDHGTCRWGKVGKAQHRNGEREAWPAGQRLTKRRVQ